MAATRILRGAYGSKHDVFVVAFRDYCDWAVKDYEKRLQGPDDGPPAQLQKFVQAATKAAPVPSPASVSLVARGPLRSLDPAHR